MHNFPASPAGRQSTMEKIAKDIRHYLSLIIILTAGFYAFAYFSFDQSMQLIVLVSTAISYVVWGAVHHYLHGDLFLSVFLEYVVIASLGMAVVFSLLF